MWQSYVSYQLRKTLYLSIVLLVRKERKKQWMCYCSMMIGGNYRIKLINKIVELSNNITVVRSNKLTRRQFPMFPQILIPSLPPKSLNDQSSSQDSASSGFRSGAWTRSFEIPSVLNRARLIEASPLIGMMTSKSSLLQEIFSRRVNYILSFAYWCLLSCGNSGTVYCFTSDDLILFCLFPLWVFVFEFHLICFGKTWASLIWRWIN